MSGVTVQPNSFSKLISVVSNSNYVWSTVIFLSRSFDLRRLNVISGHFWVNTAMSRKMM